MLRKRSFLLKCHLIVCEAARDRDWRTAFKATRSGDYLHSYSNSQYRTSFNCAAIIAPSCSFDPFKDGVAEMLLALPYPFRHSAASRNLAVPLCLS
ncbi:hypothetical protein DFH94DRAFT_275882 [Russula ochroleuca]|uniref:Uncharacterized protein n=1 Tax=Russula ochroleuca TaxID=152965 RepID=A0A9P5TCT8_9AGAM|nr:hypothetical protein DFH94DRAFT_275882 [Russula ochroleuca]